MKIRTKILLLVFLIIIITVISLLFLFRTVESFQNSMVEISKTRLVRSEKEKLEYLTLSIKSILSSELLKATGDKEAEQAVLKNVAKIAESANYSRRGFFFILDNSGTFIAHGQNPDLKGTNASDWEGSRGTNYIEEFIAQGRKGGGFVEYFQSPTEADTEASDTDFDNDTAEVEQIVTFVAPLSDIGVIGTSFEYSKILTGMEELEKKIEQNSTKIKQFIYSLILILSLTSIIISSLLAHRITKPINLITRRLKEIAEEEADLTQSIQSSAKDETREMVTYYNHFLSTLRTIISHIKSTVAEFSKLTNNIEATGHETAAATHQIYSNVTHLNKQIDNAHNRVTEAVQEIHGVNKEYAGLQEIVENLTNSASEARQISDRTSDRMAQLSQDTSNQQTTVSQLREAASTGENLAFQVQEQTDTINRRAGTILEVLEIIKDIAQRTDLLSMNASIQAAHAGEQGRGFSVVAGEIRKLSEHADESTGRIENEILAIIEHIKDTDTASKSNWEHFKQISATINEVEAFLGQLMDALQKLDSESNTITNFAATIETQSTALNTVSGHTAESMQKLISGHQELREMIETIHSGTDEIERGNKEVSDGSTNLSDMIQKSVEQLQRISEEIERFKV